MQLDIAIYILWDVFLISFLTEKNKIIGRTIYVSILDQENGGKNHVGISVSMQKFIYDPYFCRTFTLHDIPWTRSPGFYNQMMLSSSQPIH